jgi:hypothetical protein
VQAKADQMAVLFDQLSDNVAFLHRLEGHRILGPLIKFYRKRSAWSADKIE